ncbi:Crp/Fnr family transcriptional regulator [Deinococcus misasensis]|uniref:Crp/Fnr family transcriptional regulator n=1 Tax=Deinococcus misasensis TaxID=392413 RepID=UPI001B801C79|nr:Crp/Fnr family transcriptional regulator [Deinococcus misasensis]
MMSEPPVSSIPEVIHMLSLTPIFQGLGQEDLTELAVQFKERHFLKGEQVFLQGDPVERVHILIRGCLRVYKEGVKANKQITLHLEKPYRAVALVAVFLDRPEFPASCEALENSTVLVMDRARFMQIVTHNATLAQSVIRYQARKQGELMHLLDRLFFREVGARVAETLLQLQDEHGNGFMLPTNAVMAAQLGTVPELISRKLGEFFRQGLIQLEGRKVWVLRTDVLQDLSIE